MGREHDRNPRLKVRANSLQRRAHVPQGRVEEAQSQGGGDPALRPARLHAPRPPANVSVARPRFPLLVVCVRVCVSVCVSVYMCL